MKPNKNKRTYFYDTETAHHMLNTSKINAIKLDFEVCENCDKSLARHADGKCLYEPTEFKLRVCSLCDKAFTTEDVLHNIMMDKFVSLSFSLEQLRSFHLTCLKKHNGDNTK